MTNKDDAKRHAKEAIYKMLEDTKEVLPQASAQEIFNTVMVGVLSNLSVTVASIITRMHEVEIISDEEFDQNNFDGGELN